MTSTLDRENALKLVDEARRDGARLKPACAELGIGVNTYRRWAQGTADARPLATRPVPPHALTSLEREAILACVHEPKFASLPPGQIIPRLLDERSLYLASESSFYRVMHAAGEQQRRGRAAAPQKVGPPRRHRAAGPNAVWSWDVTYLPTHIRGQFLFLYLIIDIFSRKIVGAEVFEAENVANSATVIERAVLRESVLHHPLVLHADNGSPMKGSALHVTLGHLGITPSHSRPRVSDDNAFSESLFRTCKYRPNYPATGFESLETARNWVLAFVGWYNDEHRHSAIRYVTPAARHAGLDTAILAQRDTIYAAARDAHPGRWSSSTRNWDPVGAVWLNPENDQPKSLLEAA